MLVLNNTPFVHARLYLQYLKSALPGVWLEKINSNYQRVQYDGTKVEVGKDDIKKKIIR